MWTEFGLRWDRSWVGSLTVMEKGIVRGKENDPETTTVDVEIGGDESLELARRTLVSKILSGRFINKGAVKNILSKAWGEPAGLKITEMGHNMLTFTFSEMKEALEVIRKGPWYVMNNLVSLQFWIPDASAFELDFSLISFWIQVHGLPLGALNTMVVSKIMATFGTVKEVEDPRVEGNLLRTFMRARVEI